MTTSTTHALSVIALPCAVALCLGACAQAPVPPPKAATPGPAAAVSGAGVPWATFTTASTTLQGGSFEGFAYAEKAGDAGLGGVTPTGSAARVTGFVGAGKGSTWAGLGVMVQGAPQGAPKDLTSHTSVRLSLGSTSATSLRVRLVGTDAATQANGCYPVFLQAVTPELRAYDIPLAAFAPEGYCGSNARTTTATLPAVTAIEVTDPAVGSQRRDIDFQVGAISLLR